MYWWITVRWLITDWLDWSFSSHWIYQWDSDLCLVCVTSLGEVLQLVHSPSQREVAGLEGQVVLASVELGPVVDPPLGHPIVVLLRNAGGLPGLRLATVDSSSPCWLSWLYQPVEAKGESGVSLNPVPPDTGVSFDHSAGEDWAWYSTGAYIQGTSTVLYPGLPLIFLVGLWGITDLPKLLPLKAGTVCCIGCSTSWASSLLTPRSSPSVSAGSCVQVPCRWWWWSRRVSGVSIGDPQLRGGWALGPRGPSCCSSFSSHPMSQGSLAGSQESLAMLLGSLAGSQSSLVTFPRSLAGSQGSWGIDDKILGLDIFHHPPMIVSYDRPSIYVDFLYTLHNYYI